MHAKGLLCAVLCSIHAHGDCSVSMVMCLTSIAGRMLLRWPFMKLCSRQASLMPHLPLHAHRALISFASIESLLPPDAAIVCSGHAAVELQRNRAHQEKRTAEVTGCVSLFVCHCRASIIPWILSRQTISMYLSTPRASFTQSGAIWITPGTMAPHKFAGTRAATDCVLLGVSTICSLIPAVAHSESFRF